MSLAWDEIRQAGDQFIDDVFNPDGSGLKNLLHDVEMELLKLAAINPLKNLLLGENDPTLGGVLGKLGSLFGGGGGGLSLPSLAAGNDAALASLPHNASGTENWSGGMTWVNENGPEIADLPNGTRIYPAAASRQMMAANDSGMGNLRIGIDLNTDLFTATVSHTADQRVGAAAPAIAAGGSQLAQRDISRRQSRALS